MVQLELAHDRRVNIRQQRCIFAQRLRGFSLDAVDKFFACWDIVDEADDLPSRPDLSDEYQYRSLHEGG